MTSDAMKPVDAIQQAAAHLENDNIMGTPQRALVAPLLAAAQSVAALQAQLDAMTLECNEQARLNGMGAERELALLAHLDAERAKVKRLERESAENARKWIEVRKERDTLRLLREQEQRRTMHQEAK